MENSVANNHEVTIESTSSMLEIRESMEDIDNRIIDLLICRLSLSAQIGEVKQRTGEQVMSYSRELHVFDRYVEPLTDVGMKRDGVVGMVNMILEASRKIQQDIINTSKV